ncbi:protein-tyrosine phosphatase-like protein [Mycena pura]|uniref:Protein-tyrosine phosphatase-like protein n=1 Tax=Mycena pura TaxID=153505 RepID=A0AAD7E662_9AGAR|nr:protein-tyrosine phosphatase-like protein [Mycena pura]
MLSFASPSWQPAILARNPRKGFLGSGQARIASPIVPHVYLSDYFTAHDEKQVMALNITHVISVLDRDPTIPDCIPEDRRLHIAVADRSDVDISQYLTQTTEFITAALVESEENNVLVHCFQGVSRSAIVVCAYLVATTSMNASESIAYVQGKRSIVSPNFGFRKQLQVWGAQYYGDTTKQSRVARMTEGFAERLRELKAAAGASPSPAKLKPRSPKPVS